MEILEKVMRLVLVLLKGRRVSLGEASHRLSPKCSLHEPSVRTYAECYAWVLAISNKDKQYNINMAYTLLSYLRNSLIGYLHSHLWLSFQNKWELLDPT
jgi:hypothetical protein